MSEPLLKPPSPKFQLDRRHYIAIALVILATTPFIIYYSMSYNSVNGTTVELVTGYRSVGFFQTSIVFYVETHLWSWGGSLDTHVSTPIFSLAVDSLPIGTVSATSGTFQPRGYVTYNLKFESSDGGVARALADKTTSYLTLTVSALVSAGYYSQEITRSTSDTWTWAS